MIRTRAQTAAAVPATRPAPRGLAPTVAGLLVGVQAALLSWILVLAPAVAAFTATAAQTFNAGVSWADAARFGSDLWVLGHFGWTAVGSDALRAVVTLSPLGLPIVSALAAAALSRATSARGWPLVAGGTLGFLAVAALIAYVVADEARPSAWAGLIGAGAAAAAGLLWGNRPDNGRLLGRWGAALAGRLPPELGAAVRAAVRAAGLVLAAASALVAALAVGGWGRFAELFESLGPGVVGGIALALICLALAANLVAWMVAYLAGPGFAVGAGTAFTPFETVGGVEPALPLFGLLPAAEPPGWAGAVVLVPALAGLAAAWWSLRRLGLVWWRQLIGGQLAALMAAAGLGALVALAGGAAGPGRLAEVGAPLWPLAGWLWLELGLGAAAGSVLAARPWRRADALLVGGSAAGEPLAGGGAAAGHSASG